MNTTSGHSIKGIRRVGDLNKKFIAIFMAVLLAFMCLPIIPGNVKEAQAETVNVTGNVTYYAKYNGHLDATIYHRIGDWSATNVNAAAWYDLSGCNYSGSPTQWYDASGTPCAAPVGTIISSNVVGVHRSIIHSSQSLGPMQWAPK